MKHIIVYADGACAGNPGPGGYGVIMKYNGKTKELNGGFRHTTNNRMELLAVIKGLSAIKIPCQVDVYTDSKYVVDAINKGWAVRWKQNNWKRNKRDYALNPDLWEKLLNLIDTHKTTFHWLKGHAGNSDNERCDILAKEAVEDSANWKEDNNYS